MPYGHEGVHDFASRKSPLVQVVHSFCELQVAQVLAQLRQFPLVRNLASGHLFKHYKVLVPSTFYILDANPLVQVVH